MYENWNFEPTGKSDATHLGAQCIPCKHVAEQKADSSSLVAPALRVFSPSWLMSRTVDISLIVDMPAFDLNLLFEDEVDSEAS